MIQVCRVMRIHVAGDVQIRYLPDNTRAVPLVPRDDAHKGRVSFLPGVGVPRGGVG